MDRNLALEAVRVTEAAALNCARLTGRGDEKAADQAAVDAMRKAFDALAIDGTVVIGEGERDEAPMLYIGEKVGSGGPKVDIALDPLEGTTMCATGGPNALAVIAMADGGNLLHCPDTYMEKIAAGPAGKGVIVRIDTGSLFRPRRTAGGRRAERRVGLAGRDAAGLRAEQVRGGGVAARGGRPGPPGDDTLA